MDATADPGAPFAALGLSPLLVEALVNVGYNQPTEIQRLGIPAALAGAAGLAVAAALSLVPEDLEGDDLRGPAVAEAAGQVGGGGAADGGTEDEHVHGSTPSLATAQSP